MGNKKIIFEITGECTFKYSISLLLNFQYFQAVTDKEQM